MQKTMRTPRFWKALDELADAATDRREWKVFLGNEYDLVEPFLPSTGTLATSIACPSPGGDGCPRRVVDHDDGRIRAVCGDRPKACDDLDLNRDDIVILHLDRVRLAQALAVAFELSNSPSHFDRKPAFRIGSYDIYSGQGFPVYLTIPGPEAGNDPSPFDELNSLSGPKLLLTPTAASIPTAIVTVLDRAGVARMALDDIVIVDDKRLQPVRSANLLFASLRAQVESNLEVDAGSLAWRLPPDVRWEEISIRFVADEVVNVNFRGETRRFEPGDLGMRDARNGRPKGTWTYLKVFALKNGRLPVHHDKSADTSKLQKKKQALSKALRTAFGGNDDPISAQSGEYVTRFVINADDLRQGRADQRKRNFVEPD